MRVVSREEEACHFKGRRRRVGSREGRACRVKGRSRIHPHADMVANFSIFLLASSAPTKDTVLAIPAVAQPHARHHALDHVN